LSDKIRFTPPHLLSELLYSLKGLIEFHITNGAILHLCWAHRAFSEIAEKQYLLPIQELIYKRLVDYFSGVMAQSKSNHLLISNEPYHLGKYMHINYVYLCNLIS